MKQNHIIDIIDNQPISALSGSDRAIIQSHIDGCTACQSAYEAALLSAALLKEHADEAEHSAANANPFFQTRVLAAWREQQSAGAWSLQRLWNATGAIIASMAATTAALAVLTFVAPGADATDQQTALLVPYSAEAVVLEQDRDDNQMTNDQVISAIYD